MFHVKHTKGSKKTEEKEEREKEKRESEGLSKKACSYAVQNSSKYWYN